MSLRLIAATAIGFSTFGLVEKASAQTCTFTPTNMVFGALNTAANAPINTTSTIAISCSGVLLNTILICPNLAAGSGGAPTAAIRQMASGANRLNYQIYSDAGRSTVWGSSTWAYPSRAPQVQLQIPLGTGATTITLYGTVFANQQTVPLGNYVSLFDAANVEFRYRYIDILNPATCSPATGTVARPTFNVSALVNPSCVVSATDINFPSQGVLRTNVDAAGSISVTCTPTTTYTVSLDGGQSAGAPAARRMSRGGVVGPEFVTYGLYTDAARSSAWGSTAIGGATVTRTGTGAAQTIPVYGRVPPQNTPRAGNYSDVVVVTLTY